MGRPLLKVGGRVIEPGARVSMELPVTALYTHTPVTIPVEVIHGRKPGPRLFVSAAIHGDEINGVEVIRRLLKLTALGRLHGALIAVPIVNVHGFMQHTRYLPDRRDLNRSFPGSEKGSLAARVAHLFMEEIVRNCTHGIDLHTGAVHRENLPQIRARLDDPETERLARAFGVPVLLNADIRDGSLRQVAAELGIPMLLYEAGEALRFNELAIRAGLHGVVSVMRELGMLPAARRKHRDRHAPVEARSSSWVRAPQSGILRATVALGARVAKGNVLGVIANPLGAHEVNVEAPASGIVIGRINLPLVNEGEALFHIARFSAPHKAEAAVEHFQERNAESDLPANEPPIV
ncbi:MAG: succinylglutamate desuccinylase/aspartoacylase family protein [Gammaproteobacteria bacterium]